MFDSPPVVPWFNQKPLVNPPHLQDHAKCFTTPPVPRKRTHQRSSPSPTHHHASELQEVLSADQRPRAAPRTPGTARGASRRASRVTTGPPGRTPMRSEVAAVAASVLRRMPWSEVGQQRGTPTKGESYLSLFLMSGFWLMRLWALAILESS